MKPEGSAEAMARRAAPGRYAGLTALRGVAASMVILVHVWGIHKLPLPPALSGIVPHLTLGVPLFFVISAFSLYLSTVPRVDQPGWLNDFLIRRFMRIAPLFYVMAVFYWLGMPAITGGGIGTARFLLTISFLFGFMPGHHESLVWAGWSVGVEMIFYAILPLLLVTVRSLRSALAFAAFGVIVSGAFIDHYRKGAYPENYDWFSFFGAVGIFAAGILGYFLMQRLRGRADATRWGLGLLVAASVTGALIMCFQAKLTALPFTLALCSALPFMLLVVSQVLRPAGLITNRVFVHLGDLSFSLYLLHPPIIYFAKPLYEWLYGWSGSAGAGYGLSVLATMAMVYPAAMLAYHLIERPGIRHGERLIRRRGESERLGLVGPAA